MKSIHKTMPCVALLVILSLQSVSAGEPLKPLRTDKPPVIDGKLDDLVWQKAPFVTGFKTFIPYFGRDVAEQTTVYMLYDAENLYFAFDCYDPDPSKIKSALAERDKMRADDWICVNLDSFNDQQALYCFYVNPAGIQGDSKFSAGVEDMTVDVVWYSAGAFTERGYSVEVQIPLKSLRYSDKNPTEMSVFFERYVSRRTEHSSYPHLSPQKGYAFLTQMTPMVYYDLKLYTLFELLPAITYSRKYGDNQGKLSSTENRAEMSLTTKYGLTSDLILDATYNPDFSQIEADAGQVDVNLRYQLFFPEKRPFFLEGKEIFTIAATSASELDPLSSVIHTRKIVDPLIGIKLSGKVGDDNTVSVLYSMDELPDGKSSGTYAHFPIIRFKRALTGDSFLGGIVASNELKTGFNRVGGVDAQIRVGESSTIEAHGLLSRTTIPEDGPQGTGHALGIRYRYDTEALDYDIILKEIASNFRIDMGYLARSGIQSGTARFRPKFYPSSGIFHRIDLEGFTGQTKDKPSGMWETFNHASLGLYLRNALTARARYIYSTEVFLNQRFRTDALVTSVSGLVTNWLSISLSNRSGKAIFYSASPYQGTSSQTSASTTVQPSEQLRADLSLVYVTFHRDSGDVKIYEYPISRAKLTYQLNKYLFFRGIVEYNNFRKQMLTDFLASFTYIPGTVVHLGYGSLYQKIKWENDSYVGSDRFLETKRGLFFKMSYLWRM